MEKVDIRDFEDEGKPKSVLATICVPTAKLSVF